MYWACAWEAGQGVFRPVRASARVRESDAYAQFEVCARPDGGECGVHVRREQAGLALCPPNQGQSVRVPSPEGTAHVQCSSWVIS